MDWREEYERIVEDVGVAVRGAGGEIYGIANVHAAAHVLLLEWAAGEGLPAYIVFAKLSRSANGWWGLPVALYERVKAERPDLRRVALFLTGCTRGYFLDEEQIEFRRADWKIATSVRKRDEASRASRVRLLELLGLSGDTTHDGDASAEYRQHHIVEKQIARCPRFRDAGELVGMLRASAERAVDNGHRTTPHGGRGKSA